MFIIVNFNSEFTHHIHIQKNTQYFDFYLIKLF